MRRYFSEHVVWEERIPGVYIVSDSELVALFLDFQQTFNMLHVLIRVPVSDIYETFLVHKISINVLVVLVRGFSENIS